MATVNNDVVSVDPTAAYEDGDFVITGHASSPLGVRSVSLRGLGNSGTVSLGTTTVDASGSFSFAVPILGTSLSGLYVTETNGSGAVKEVSAELFLDGKWVGKPYVATEDQFNALGQRTQSLYFREDGSVEGAVNYNTSGSAVSRRQNNPDGSNTITVIASGTTVSAVSDDTIENALKPGDTFVFDPGHGLDVVRQFLGNGADHDTLSFKGSDFGNSIAEVLADTHQYRGVGTYIVDPVSGDAVRLTNVSKAELAVNKGDITFHP